MLPLGPHSHLDETHQGEEGHRQALGHQCEAEPGAQLQEEEEGRYTQSTPQGGSRRKFKVNTLIGHHLMNVTCYLIGVVGAGDQQEDPGEGVLGWIGYLPGLRPLMKKKKGSLVCVVVSVLFSLSL